MSNRSKIMSQAEKEGHFALLRDWLNRILGSVSLVYVMVTAKVPNRLVFAAVSPEIRG